MLAVRHLDDEVHAGEECAVLGGGDRVDIGAGLRDLRGDARQHAALVLHHDLDRRLEQARGARIPFSGAPLVRLVLTRADDRRAVPGAVRQALALLDRADRRVARDRPAAGRSVRWDALPAAYG